MAALAGAKGSPAGVRIRAVGNPFLALAELCRVTREERRTGTAPGPTNARLVIVYPEMLNDAAELCAAADTYAPGVPRWQYGPAPNPSLRPIVDDDVARWQGGRSEIVVTEAGKAHASSRTAQAPTPPPPPLPKLRLAGEGPVVDNQHDSADAVSAPPLAGVGPAQPAPPTERNTPLISDEELRMLLGENNDENR